MALPDYAAYAATKAAVDSLTRSAAVALAKHGVRVNSLSPGMMDTPLQQRTERIFCELAGRDDLEAFKAERTARIPLGRRSDPEEMAADGRLARDRSARLHDRRPPQRHRRPRQGLISPHEIHEEKPLCRVRRFFYSCAIRSSLLWIHREA